jgi:ABC-type uncharacterized transport system auxiliary subunit
MKKILLYFISVSIITGCSILEPIKTANMQYYLLQYKPGYKPCNNHSDITLQILPTQANSPYNTYNMYYSNDPYTLNQYSYSSWAILPEETINQAMQQTLNNSCTFGNILTADTTVTSKYQLTSQLIQLKQNIDNTKSSATLIIKVQLIDKNTNIIKNKTFTQTSTIEISPQGMASGTSANLQQFLTNLIDWLSGFKYT